MSTQSQSSRATLLTAFALTLPFLAVALATSNPVLTAFAVLVLAAIVVLLHRPGEPPVLLFVCVMQWLQAVAKVLHADVLGVALHDLPAAHHLGIAAADTIERAAALSLTWALCVAIGMRLALWGVAARPEERAPRAEVIDAPRLLAIYLGWTLVMLVLGTFARGGVQQFIVAIADLRWAVVYALFWVALRRPRQRVWLVPIFLVEVMAGFLSFFASFRTPVFLLGLAVASGSVRVRTRHMVGLAVVGVFALYLGVVWSAIKGEYRTALNRGSGEQVIAIGQGAQFAELTRLIARVDGATLEDGLERLVDRIGYIDYFAYCLEHVPAIQPHEGGLLWRNAVAHVLQPRLFFPGKPELESDTILTERYTGLDLMSWTETTSVALGMPAEAYVDFGLPWMFVAGIWIGLLCGWLQRVAVRGGPDALLRDGLAVALLLPLAGLEPSTTKFFGGYLTRALVATALWMGALRRAAAWVHARAPRAPAAVAAAARPAPAPQPPRQLSRLAR